MSLDRPDLEVAVYGRNLTNTQYYTNQFDSYSSLAVSQDFQGNPRTYGVTLTYRFE